MNDEKQKDIERVKQSWSYLDYKDLGGWLFDTADVYFQVARKHPKPDILEGIEELNFEFLEDNVVEYYRKNGDRIIRFHDIDLLTFHAEGYLNGYVTINANGHHTHEVRDMINKHLGIGTICINADGK